MISKSDLKPLTLTAILILTLTVLWTPKGNASIIADVTVNPTTTTVGRIYKVFDVNVTTSDVTNLYAYEFKLSYNTTLLDVVKISNGTFFPSYPKSYVIRAEWNETSGDVWFATTLVAPETAKSGNGLLSTITFNATYSTLYPEKAECPLHLYDVKLSDSYANAIVFTAHDGKYGFIPLLGDINGDGKIDITDIAIVAIAFGTKPEDKKWDPRADLKPDGIIDIYDVVLVAVNFGKVG